MLWLALLAAAGLAAFLFWWLIIETEGVYLGRRVVVGLYDLYAHRYDRIKQFDEYADLTLIAAPILERVAPRDDPLILDVGTGAGRLPLLMARNGRFRGRVIGLDASRRMLERARRKVEAERFDAYISLLHGDASKLRFPDDCFDVVTCLETLEFLPDPRRALAEMIRVLRPGGLLLTTIRIDTRWMPNRTWSEVRMRRELSALDMEYIDFAVWQEDYSQVWARKAGESRPRGADSLQEILRQSGQVPIIGRPHVC